MYFARSSLYNSDQVTIKTLYMIFSLEALQAKHGDSLLLYYGKKTNPRIIIVDGGPAGIYKGFLKPRLLEIKNKFSPGNTMPISMVMVSHLDDDHVNGILALTDEVVDKDEDNEPQDFGISNIWVNTFDDIIGNIQLPVISSVAASAQATDFSGIPEIATAEQHIAAVIASTAQGRRLRDNAGVLSANVNNPFPPIKKTKVRLVRGDGKGTALAWDTGIKIRVIHPNLQRLNELQTKWDKDLKKAKAKGDNSIIMATITDPDTSPFNLSSIVCLVEAGGKKILLTGDARTDDIIEGLKHNKLLDKKGHLKVDLLKLPHHGSVRNADADFFKIVTADHYIISADGLHKNPDKGLLDIIADVKLKGTLYFTNHSGKLGLKKKLDNFVKKLKSNGSKLKVVFRKDAAPSVRVDLLEKLNF